MTRYHLDYETYLNLCFGGPCVSEENFERLIPLAVLKIERATAGADNVSKLKYCTPTDPDDLYLVQRCITAVINLMSDIENIGAVRQTDNGLLPNLIGSVHAGNESITYVTAGATSAVLTASQNPQAKESLIYSTICEYLSGMTDVNGINMLYLGPYPYTITKEEENEDNDNEEP